jgi:hypothetical protein
MLLQEAEANERIDRWQIFRQISKKALKLARQTHSSGSLAQHTQSLLRLPPWWVEKPLSELAGAAANPLNIPLDVQTVADLKAV